MRTLVSMLLVAGLFAGGCSTVGEAVDDVRGRVDATADTARFCLAITRALTSLDGGTSPQQASDAAEEVLAQVPEELQDDARIVAEGLRHARDGEAGALDDPAFRDAARRLRDRTRERCDPTS